MMSAWEAPVRPLYCHTCPQLRPCVGQWGYDQLRCSSLLGSLKRVSHPSLADGDIATACSQLKLLMREH